HDTPSGLPTSLSGLHALVFNESIIYRQDRMTHVFKPFAENPWPEPTANRFGNFVFDEPRFPLHNVERGPDGQPLLDKDGLQIWVKNDLHVGMTTAFEAANRVLHASEGWAGRPVPWGVDGKLEIGAHGFIDLNAFYSPITRAIFFGVAPYRLPGEQQVRIFETASS